MCRQTFFHPKTFMYFLAICNVNFLLVHSRRKLFIGGMFSGSEHSSLQSVCENALELVNNRSDILPEYELYLLPNDTKCNEGYSTRVLFEYLSRNSPIIMLLGAGCSSVTRAVAQAAHQWNLFQVSYTPTSVGPTSHARYPMLYRVVISQTTLNKARLEFFKLYKWKRIATLLQNDNKLKEMMVGLHLELARQNFTLVISKVFTTEPKSELIALKENGVHVIVGMFEEDKARKVFCEAFKLGMYGPKYVWLLLDWYDYRTWWLTDNHLVDCTKKQMYQATNGYFSIENMKPLTNDKPGISGLTSQDIRIRSSSMYAPFAFDSVWVIVLSLQKTSQKLHLENKTLDSFTYENKDMANIIQESIEGLSFQGVTGHIAFSTEGDRISPVKIKQLQNEVHKTVAVYYPALESIKQNNTDKVMWQGLGPPADSQHHVRQTTYIAWPLFWFIIAFTSFGILSAIMLLAFNTKYRQNSYIKLSSPFMNNVILVGAFLVYASVYSIVLDSRVLEPKRLPTMCSVTVFLSGTGYSLMFGAMFSKTWRVHQVFNKVYPKRKIFKWSELMGLVLIPLMMDCIVFSLWIALDPFTISIKTTNEKIDSKTVEPITFKFEYCHSNYMTTWYYVIFGYKGLMLLVGCFVAWETRQFKVRSLNDSRFIGMGIFTFTVAAFIGVPLTFLLKYHRNAHVATLSLSVLLPTTILLSLLFVPKIWKISKHSEEFLMSQTVMRTMHEYRNDHVQESSNDHLNTAMLSLQVDSPQVENARRAQKSLASSIRAKDKNSYNELNIDTTRSRNPLAIRSNTCVKIKDGHQSQHSSQHRRCNTFSASHPPNSHATQDSHMEDLKVENETLKQRLRQTKINEAGKMCKILYENAELNRKVAELNLKQTPGSESDLVSRLMKENNELKRQLGEVSILNSVCSGVTPKLTRKGTAENKRKKDLKELQHLLTVGLGGVRTNSFGASSTARPPTIGLSQSSLNLFDPQESPREAVVGNSDKDEKRVKGNGQEDQETDNEKAPTPFKEIKLFIDQNGYNQQLANASSNSYKSPSSSDESRLPYADNQGYASDEIDEFASDTRKETEQKPAEKQFDKTWATEGSSNTRELLRKGKVRLRSETSCSTYDMDEHEYELRRTLSADCIPSTLPFSRVRTVVGSANNKDEFSSTNDGVEGKKRNGEYLIERKRRKSKRDKKTEITKVEKTFFV